ncbi:MAG: HAD family hydrolase [Deltaproteobacteria bacterium]|nr:HAD family hydrolase [Deltaproteobacteria bacterium]
MTDSPPSVFIDRDGTLIEEVNYLSRLDQMVLIPGAGAAVARVNRAGLPVVVVSNQAGVARGFFPESFASEDSPRHLKNLLAAQGAAMQGYYYCPHHTAGIPPYNIDCDCRKPKPGMLLQARSELGVRLEGSYFIGDRVSDVETGREYGMVPILVRTGYGRENEPLLSQEFFQRGGQVFDLLPQALDWIVQRETSPNKPSA